MPNSAPPTRTPQNLRRQRNDRLVGGGIVALGIVVLVVAIMALYKPHGRNAGNAVSHTSTTHASTTPSPTHKAAHRSSSAPPTSSAAGTSAAGTSSAATSGAATTSVAALKQVPLIVLNNSLIPGLAAQAQQTFINGGWTVPTTGNLQNDIISTAAYYDPSDPINKQAAEELQKEFPAIKRVVPRFDGLPAGPIVVVLTADYTG